MSPDCFVTYLPDRSAYQWVTRGREEAVARRERGHEAWALWALGEIEEQQHPADPNRSSTHYSQALAIATELGMRPLAARCHLALATKHRATDPRTAQQHLTIAATMFRDMDMRFWLEKAEAASTELGA